MKIHENQAVLEAGKNLEEAAKAVVMIHGRGATAQSMIQLSEQLPEATYLAPQAKNRTWYPNPFMEPEKSNQPHLDSALGKVDSLVERCSEQVGRENVFLIGFSQGACLISEYCARNPAKYGGVIILSGGLIGQELNSFSGDMKRTEVFIGCAENDPHIPVERVNDTADIFEDLNAEVEKHIFEGSHHGIVAYEIERAQEIIS